MIYEGANGVQAMDLVGRKLAQNGGRAIQAFFAIVDEECGRAKGDEALADFAGRLEKANGELKAATMWFMQNGMANPNNVGAGAHHYMHILGIVALGSMRSEEHTSELQSLMRISYAVFCLKKKKQKEDTSIYNYKN